MVLCVGRVPLVAVWLKPSCRWLAPSSGWPLETVGAWREEGEREARWEEREREARWEGREREAALGSSPPPSLGSSPLPTLGSSPLLPGTLGLVTGASAGADAGGALTPGGGTHDPEAWGWAGAPRRRRRAAFSRLDLPQLLLLNSTCELARAAGVGVLSGGVCERARREISFARARRVG